MTHKLRKDARGSADRHFPGRRSAVKLAPRGAIFFIPGPRWRNSVLMTMMSLSNKETFTPVSPIFGFIQELCQVSDDQGKGVEVIQKGRGLFWPVTEAARNDMTQLGRLELQDGKTITDVLSQATVRWCILSVSDSVGESLTTFPYALGLTAGRLFGGIDLFDRAQKTAFLSIFYRSLHSLHPPHFGGQSQNCPNPFSPHCRMDSLIFCQRH